MKCLSLSGYGIKINVDNAKLIIQDGRSSVDLDKALKFNPPGEETPRRTKTNDEKTHDDCSPN